ncbi:MULTISPECIES: multidrug effflux MFS transporter [Serratia]|jgi:DHA1 family bicyclomycin/chloramphenicol resistance-like MFS transporter|uniref:Bcr/CflA family efflux transporter n=1 Tax=Serratia fonticola TaxID=47917 RepID=A0AAE7JTL3_SERFO|nr:MULTISPECIES: multidrug effflux MFS transporter [Serratia]MBC3218212.1 multidrug effflux MFS transporter [Serratia fonticola]MCO7512343.1 multidrug effflux MFS transporter [Serratia fonticola]NBJ33294.1 Bcr/CflA family efflux MFS transporter [Serratia fonticola]NCG50025.1 Bcr/CflA family efflux MFS transporter [Serratia fonticola]OCJ28229.1 Bcr/CflA family drug resistance efflux transporter [Serratia sp. 14-2641]
MQKFLFLLLSLVLLGPLGIDLYLPTIPAIALGLNSSEALIQSTISLFILVLGLGQVIAGPLVDNYGRKPVAIAGILIYMAGAVMAALATTAEIFVASRLMQGVAVCCTAVVAFSGVRDRMNGDDAARAFGFLNGTLNIIPALAPLLGGLLAEAFGWRAPFWFLVGYAAVVLLLVIFFLPETRPATTVAVKGLPVRQYLRILGDRRFISFAVVNAGAMGMALTYVSLAPNVLMGTAGLSPLQFSLVFGANGFWIMLVSFVANRIIHKIGRPFCLATGGILMGLGCLALVLGVALLGEAAQSHWLAYILPVACACAGLAFVMGPSTSYALEPYSNEAGVASALVGFIQMAGGAALGLIAMALPLQPKLSLALVMLVGCLLALHARQRSKQIKGQLKKIG